ncbi:MAG TPA: hypothetical protein VFC02_13005 [Anaerolineales bacterium]|nr:hypothetical protein [Anaerolineales bacterium]
MATPNLIEHMRLRGFNPNLLVYNQQDVSLFPGKDVLRVSHWPDPYPFWGKQQDILNMTPKQLRDMQVDVLANRLKMQHSIRNQSNGHGPMVTSTREIHPVMMSEAERARRNMGIDGQATVKVNPMFDKTHRYTQFDRGMDDTADFWGTVGPQHSFGGVY